MKGYFMTRVQKEFSTTWFTIPPRSTPSCITTLLRLFTRHSMMTTCSETAPDGLAPILEDVSSVTLEDMDTLASQLVQRALGLTNENSMETALYEAYNTAALLHTFAIAVSLVDDSVVDGRPTPACGGALNTGADAYEISIYALANLVRNSLIRRSDLPVSLPTDVFIPTFVLNATGWTSGSKTPNAFTFSRDFIKTLLRAIKPNPTRRSSSISRSSSRSRLTPLSIKHHVINPQHQRDSLVQLLSVLLVAYASSEGSYITGADMITDSPRSSRSATIDDDNSSLADSPLSTPVSSSDDLPTVAIVARSNTTSTPHHDFTETHRSEDDDDQSHPHIYKEQVSLRRSTDVGKVLASNGIIGPSNSGSSSSASSFTRVSSISHSTGRTRARTRASSILSLCSASVRSASPQRSRHDRIGSGAPPTLIKSMSTTSITSSEKSSMGSFTPVTAKTAAGSLRMMISPSMSPSASWPVLSGEGKGDKARRSIFHVFGDYDDKSEPEDLESEDAEGVFEGEDDGDLDTDNRTGRLPIRMTITIPSVSLTQASFTPPSPINDPNGPLVNPANKSNTKAKVPSSLRQLAHEQHHRRSSTVPPPVTSHNRQLPPIRGVPSSAQRQFVSSPLSPNRNPSSKFRTYFPVSTNPPSPTSPNAPARHDPEFTLPLPPLDPTLAALEKKCKLKTKIKCSNCGVVGWDFARGRNGQAFCSRDCRLAVKERTKLGLTLVTGY